VKPPLAHPTKPVLKARVAVVVAVAVAVGTARTALPVTPTPSMCLKTLSSTPSPWALLPRMAPLKAPANAMAPAVVAVVDVAEVSATTLRSTPKARPASSQRPQMSPPDKKVMPAPSGRLKPLTATVPMPKATAQTAAAVDVAAIVAAVVNAATAPSKAPKARRPSSPHRSLA
jgi:hypothetical protein